MQNGLTIQGDLADLPVPEILRNLRKNEGISSLSLTRDEHTCQIYAKKEEIVSAGSNDPDFSMVTILLVKGEIALEEFLMCRDQRRDEESVISRLVRLNILSPDDMLHSIDVQVKYILEEVITWTRGEYVMVFDDRLPEDMIPAKINTDETMLEIMRKIDRWSLVLKGLGGMRKIYRKTRGMDARFYDLSLSEDEGHVYSLLESPQTVSEICEMSYLKDFLTLRSLWALKCINLVEEILVAEPKLEHSEADEYLLSSIVESYNNAFSLLFQTLEKDMGEEIFTFVDQLLEGLDEGTRKLLSNCDFRNEGRLDFDQLYNNFVSAGITQFIQTFQDILNEVLYGWVFKIKQQHGDRYNEILDQAINSIHEE